MAGLAALTVVVLLGLPWPQIIFGALSLAIATLFAVLSTAAGNSAMRWIMLGGCVFWLLGAIANFYSAPGYNIRPDLVLTQVFGLPITVLVEGLVVVVLWVTSRP